MERMNKLLLLILLLVFSSCKSKSDTYYASDNIIHSDINCKMIETSSVIFKIYQGLDTSDFSFCKSCMSEKEVLFLDHIFVVKKKAEDEMYDIAFSILKQRGNSDLYAFEFIYSEINSMSDHELYGLYNSIDYLHEKYKNEKAFKYSVRKLLLLLGYKEE